MTINPRLDPSPENYPLWGPDRTTVTPENVAEKSASARRVADPVPPAALERYPVGIRCYLISVADIAKVKKWRKRLHRVLRDLPPELEDYKGLTRFRQMVINYFAPFDDGAVLSNGDPFRASGTVRRPGATLRAADFRRRIRL